MTQVARSSSWVRAEAIGADPMLHLRKSRPNETDGLQAIEAAVCENLRALGLHVRSKRFRRGFCEVVASSSPRLITTPDGELASGIMLLLAQKYDPPLIVFEEINSLRRGLGRAMVAAALDGVSVHPGVFRHIRVNDLSPFQPDGRRWWENIADLHPSFEWIITHEGDAAHDSGAA